MIVHTEPEHTAGQSDERLYTWVEEHGFTPVDLPREVFLSDPHAERLVIAGELSPELRGHLAHFAFPVSAGRCEDFARFFNPYDGERSAIKSAQARLYGEALAHLMARDYTALSRTFSSLADLEERFQAFTLQANAAP